MVYFTVSVQHPFSCLYNIIGNNHLFFCIEAKFNRILFPSIALESSDCYQKPSTNSIPTKIIFTPEIIETDKNMVCFPREYQ